MSNIEYSSTQRKGECLIFNNYYFRIDKKIKNKKYWKCIENCGARIIISDNQMNSLYLHSDKFCNHNHSPRPVKIEVNRFKVKLRLRAKENPLEPIPKVIIKILIFFGSVDKKFLDDQRNLKIVVKKNQKLLVTIFFISVYSSNFYEICQKRENLQVIL
jgi:hypothetical protein